MTIKRNSGSGGVPGSTISVANSGGVSGTNWDDVIIGAGGTAQYIANTGPLEGSIIHRITPGSGQVCQVRWDFPPARKVHLIVPFVAPAAVSPTSTFMQIRSAGTDAASWQIQSTPRITQLNDPGTTVYNNALANLTPGAAYQAECIVDVDASNIHFALYAQGDLVTELAEFNPGGGQNVGVADLTNIRLGRTSPATTNIDSFDFGRIQLFTDSDVTAVGVGWPTGFIQTYIRDTGAWVANREGELVRLNGAWN